MRAAVWVAGALLAIALTASTGACGEVDRPTCYAGDYVGCSCPNGARGLASCDADGQYGACVCDGRTPGLDASPGDAAIEVEASTQDGGKKGFLDNCTTNDECASGLCKDYPAKGTFCSKGCTTATAATDCPPPSTGCNKDGVCKAP